MAISSLVAGVPLGKDDVEGPTVTECPGEDTAVLSAEFATAVLSAEFAAGCALVAQPLMMVTMPRTPHAATSR
ncbi:MAG: hypothetical protein ACR2P2_15730 [Nakamurella sp.]